MSRATIIAEVGLNHDGSLSTALAYIHACQDAGADIVKFQFHMPQESTKDDPFRTPTVVDRTRQDYWRRTGFHEEQWLALARECASMNVGFMTSVFCDDAVMWARGFGQTQWKIPSGQVVNVPLLRAISQRDGDPVYISTGLCTEQELMVALAHFMDRKVTLLHCVTSYPTTPKQWRHGQLDWLHREFGHPVGLSDHSGSIAGPLAACARFPLDAIEVHVKLSKWDRSPDAIVSLEMDDLRRLVEGVRAIEESRIASPVDPELWRRARQMYMPTLIAKVPIEKGTQVQLNHLIYRKSGGGPGLPWLKVVGRTLARDIIEGQPFIEEDFETACAPSASS